MTGAYPMQATAGAAWRFYWRATAKPTAAPDVVFGAPLSVTKTLTPLRAAGTVASVAADLRTITLNPAIGASSRGLVGDEGAAWLDLGQGGQFPVRVATFTSSTVLVLAEPLPTRPGNGTGTIHWLTYYANLTSGEVGADVARRVPWRVQWTAYEGADHQGEPRHDQGLLDVVTTPFSTGVGHEAVLDLVPMLADMVPARQRSWERQVQIALREVVGWIEEALPRGRFVDQLAGDQFALVHALLAAHHILQGHRSVGYRRDEVDFYADAKLEFARQAKRLRWLDGNSDGVVDEGETDVPAGAYAAVPTSLWQESDYTDTTPTVVR
ncbi:MAG: hypothetical protein EKK55_16350 [Rhodocyclaceae bacterium]|nr:MAG: hypothetical protein EKK55_16350 [Rhodocyclaceae bacterium]